MKKILLLSSLLFFSGAVHGDKPKPKSFVHVMYSRMDIFYFKIEKEFLGAELEIYSQDGVKLLSNIINHRKILIDFYYENPGNFIIHFKKGELLQEFNFVKTEPCFENDKPSELISVVQGI